MSKLMIESLLLAAAVCGTPMHAAQSIVPDDVRDRAVEVVVTSFRTGELAGDDLATQLDAIVPEAGPFLFEMIGARGVPADWSASNGDFLALDDSHLSAMSGALLRMPRAALRELLEVVASSEPRIQFRAVGVDLIGEVGDATDVRLAVDLARPLRDGHRVLPRMIRKRFERALVSILDRDAGGFPRVGSLFGQIHVGLQSTVADAVSRFSNELALETVAGMLGRARGLDAHLLTAISRIAPLVALPIDAGVRANVRAFLFHVDEEVVRTAIRAVGLLEDFDALPVLIEGLADAESEDSDRIHRALMNLTGLGLRNDAVQWEKWYDNEQRWWDEESATITEDLRSGSDLLTTRAIGSLAGRRLRRHAVAEILQEVVSRPEPAIASLACHALSELGSPVAIPALIEAMTHSDEQVREAAWRALGEITGYSLPQDVAAWRAST